MAGESEAYDMYEAIKRSSQRASDLADDVHAAILSETADAATQLVLTNRLLLAVLLQLNQSELHRVLESDPDNRRVSGGRIATDSPVPVRVSDR